MPYREPLAEFDPAIQDNSLEGSREQLLNNPGAGETVDDENIAVWVSARAIRAWSS
jgi:hypothetical protein